MMSSSEIEKENVHLNDLYWAIEVCVGGGKGGAYIREINWVR